MKNRYASILFALVFTLTAAHAAERKSSWFDGMLHPLPVTPALPANFIAVSLWPDTRTTKQFNMEEGVLWAPEHTARHFEFGADKTLSNATEPLFYVKLSATVSQVPGTAKFNHEEKMSSSLTSSGVKNVKSKKTKWGEYPVLAFTGEAQGGLAMFTAFVGINSPDGWVIVVNYRVPGGKGHPTNEEKKIWERFLDETKSQK